MRGFDSIQDVLREAGVLTIFVFFSGLLHLVAYYTQFGLRLSDVDLEYYHILYRGIAMMFTDFFSMVLFLVVLLCMFGYSSSSLVNLRRPMSIKSICHFTILVCFPVAFLVAQNDGVQAARRDMDPNTSTLPKLLTIKHSTGIESVLAERLMRANRTVLLVHRSGNKLTLISPPTLPPRIDVQNAIQPIITTVTLKSGDYYEEM